jgi:transposase InsO family protein
MDYSTKWSEGSAIPNQEASAVAEALVINFFCRSEYHGSYSDQGHNFESRLIQEVLQCLGVSKTRTTPPHLQLNGMVEHYISQGAHTKSHCVKPEGMVRQTAHLPPYSQDIHSRHYGLDAS